MTRHSKRSFSYDLEVQEEGDWPLHKEKESKDKASAKARPRRVEFSDFCGSGSPPDESPPRYSPLERNCTQLQARVQHHSGSQPAWMPVTWTPPSSEARDALERDEAGTAKRINTGWLLRGQAACDGIDEHAAAINASIAELERRCVAIAGAL
jgi:hypothetical protein